MEENRTLTGVERKYVEKHKGILERRLSYLNERYQLRQNSFDGAECSALRHVIWLITLELTDGIRIDTVVPVDNKTAEPQKTKTVLRKKNESQ